MREPDEWMKPYIKRLRVQGFFVVRRGQAVDHDGNVCNLADIRTD